MQFLIGGVPGSSVFIRSTLDGILWIIAIFNLLEYPNLDSMDSDWLYDRFKLKEFLKFISNDNLDFPPIN